MDLLQYLFNEKCIKSQISIEETKHILQRVIRGISQKNFNYLIDQYIPKDCHRINWDQFQAIYCQIYHESLKVNETNLIPNGKYLFNSFISVKKNSIIKQLHRHPSDQPINVPENFDSVLQPHYLKKLIKNGGTGIIYDKQETMKEKYSYFFWVQCEVQFIFYEQESKYLQLLKLLWSFQFAKASCLIQSMADLQSNNLEITSFISALNSMKQISQLISQHSVLRPYFIGRQKFKINIDQKMLNRSQRTGQLMKGVIKPFKLYDKIIKIRQTLIFCAEFFQSIINQLQNPFLKAAAIFLSNKNDPRYKKTDKICWMECISISERFLYAKKFLCPEQFNFFQTKLIQIAEKSSLLDYILLFGTHKESEIILQNYLNQTNDIRKVAIISVYLKIFSEQIKINLRQSKSLFSKFIKIYEWLLQKKDGGISRHLFDKKCLTIEIQRKRITFTKTFSFDCLNCKNSQLSSALVKRIGLDAKQPKMKGYQYFAKDSRTQVMHCIDCMELLPRCCICLYPVTVFNGYSEQLKVNNNFKRNQRTRQNLAMALVWCPKCSHGGHFKHIIEWQQKNQKNCPVSHCKCKCIF